MDHGLRGRYNEIILSKVVDAKDSCKLSPKKASVIGVLSAVVAQKLQKARSRSLSTGLMRALQPQISISFIGVVNLVLHSLLCFSSVWSFRWRDQYKTVAGSCMDNEDDGYARLWKMSYKTETSKGKKQYYS